MKAENATILRELAAKCEAAEGPDRELDALIAPIAREDVIAWPTGGLARKLHNGKHAVHSADRFTASLDAAKALADGRRIILNIAEDEITTAIVDGTEATAFTPALALTSACLKALASMETLP